MKEVFGLSSIIFASLTLFLFIFIRYGTSMSNTVSSGTGNIWKTNVRCYGSESKLDDCRVGGAAGTCKHSDDVGIYCFNETLNSGR